MEKNFDRENREVLAIYYCEIVDKLRKLECQLKGVRKYSNNMRMHNRLQTLENKIILKREELIEKYQLKDYVEPALACPDYQAMGKKEVYRLSRKIYYGVEKIYNKILEDLENGDINFIADDNLLADILLLGMFSQENSIFFGH